MLQHQVWDLRGSCCRNAVLPLCLPCAPVPPDEGHPAGCRMLSQHPPRTTARMCPCLQPCGGRILPPPASRQRSNTDRILQRKKPETERFNHTLLFLGCPVPAEDQNESRFRLGWVLQSFSPLAAQQLIHMLMLFLGCCK